MPAFLFPQIGFIRPHPILTRLFSEAAETTLSFDAFVIPMLCPPVPWVSPSFGAYILSPTKLIRCMDGAVQHQLLLERCPRGNLFAVMDALNQLGNCPWKINQAILNVVISVFNDKGDEKLDVPPPPSEAPQPTKLALGGTPLSKSALRSEVAQCRKRAMEMFSLRMDTLYKLSIAKHMGDRPFWFPHNMDFRGRTYPCPPHFNHLGSDLTRAILLFAQGKPLGPQGLDWLKIHLVNLTGLKKKSSLQDRLAYANSIMVDILDSADHPLTVRRSRLRGWPFPPGVGAIGIRGVERWAWSGNSVLEIFAVRASLERRLLLSPGPYLSAVPLVSFGQFLMFENRGGWGGGWPAGLLPPFFSSGILCVRVCVSGSHHD